MCDLCRRAPLSQAEVVQRDAESLFKVLVDKYKPSLSRDPSLTVVRSPALLCV